MQVRSRACLLPCRQGLIRHGRSPPSSLDDVPSFVVVESAPDAVNGSGFEGVFEALDADGAAAADLLGFGGFGSAVDEENVAVDTQAGCVVPPGGVVFGGEHVDEAATLAYLGGHMSTSWTPCSCQRRTYSVDSSTPIP